MRLLFVTTKDLTVRWETTAAVAGVLRVVWSETLALLHALWVGWSILVAADSSDNDNVEDKGEDVEGTIYMLLAFRFHCKSVSF